MTHLIYCIIHSSLEEDQSRDVHCSCDENKSRFSPIKPLTSSRVELQLLWFHLRYNVSSVLREKLAVTKLREEKYSIPRSNAKNPQSI